MTTKVVFDSATLSDAIQKAARIAPHKGAAYDKASGIFLEVKPEQNVVVVSSTDLDVSYRQTLVPTQITGERTDWRIPSVLLAGLMTNLPLGSGTSCTFIDTGTDSFIRIKSGSVAVKLHMIEGTFPTIHEFDDSGMVGGNDFARKVSQVAWACAKQGDGLLSGVHVNGTHLIGCDRQSAALVPCVTELDSPVTVPLWILAPILRNATDVRVGSDGTHLNIQLDSETQARTTLLVGDYPNVLSLRRSDYTGNVLFDREAFNESVQRMLVIGRSDRMPRMKLSFNSGLVKSCTLDLEVEGAGRIQDTIDVTGSYSDPFEILFTPKSLVDAMASSSKEKVTMEFGHPDPARGPLMPVRLSDETGYEVLLTPRRP